MEQSAPSPARTATTHLVRDAGATDLAGILHIYNQAVQTSTAVYTEQEATLDERLAWLTARRAQGYPVLVAAEPISDAVLGYATFGDFRPWPGYRHTVEHSVYVHADARGRGIGAALVERLIGLAGAAGKHVMVGGIDAANPASLRLHERLGFERAGMLREVGTKFGRWLDLVLMQRFLHLPPNPSPPATMVER